MKKALIFVLTALLNIVVFFVLQIMAQFVQFFIYGEGVASDKYLIWVLLFFVIIHMIILTALYRYKTIIKSGALFAVTTLTVIGLYVYFNFMLGNA
jgi:membrane protein YdbS with pleckstrin-like domain